LNDSTAIISSDDKPVVAIVDDSVETLKALSKLLPLGGFDTITFASPSEALEQILWLPPAIVLVDLYMPEMTGLEFIARLRERSASKPPPCIILSGATEETAITEAFEAGASDYLRKPFSKGELFAKLKRVLGALKRKVSRPRRMDAPASIGPHRVIEEIGRGSMGVVYKVLGAEGAPRALKAIWSQQSDLRPLMRFRREVDILSSLDHPNLVKTHEAGREGSLYYYLMDFIDGSPLDRYCADSGALSADTVGRLVYIIANALDYLHDRQLVHRDIKPSNMLLNSQCVPYLADFGLAKCFADTQLTLHSELIGTPNYMAPEVISGVEIDGRADLFSLGVVAMGLLRNKLLVEAESPYTVMLQITSGRYLRGSDVPGLPPLLCEVLDAMLETRVEDRCASAREVAAALAPSYGGHESILGAAVS
jgi:CheY-like chemotaxis protein